MAKVDKSTYDTPSYRPLKVYAFDPSHGRSLGNYMTVNVRYEGVEPGPVGEYLEVIDYDASNDCYYEPVDLNDAAVMLGGGLEPSGSDPRFHQQMVYAVASETIRRFEFALGRKIKWGFRADTKGKRRLRIFPHGMQEANAYYDRDLRALVFGYFPASELDAGANLPGQTVFTCLSHDIIVHETTHALIDGQRIYFLESTGPDSLAFHEAFADIVALFQHFSHKEALLEMIQRTGGLIYRLHVDPEVNPGREGALAQFELSTSNPLVQLARQFGEALGTRAALRSALGSQPNSKDLDKLYEPHDRGAILVAAVFDAFFSIYIRRTRDLMRIARAAGALINPGDIHPDLANRLAGEAAKTAEHFSNICIRALDYCPPVDILFGDFLRALVTADYDLVPADPYGYRAALIEAFRLRGIRPENVTSYSEGALRWCAPEDLKGMPAPPCEGLEFDILRPSTSEQSEKNAKTLINYANKNRDILGLSLNEPIQAHSFHPVHRVGPDGRLKVEVVAELVQQRATPFDPTESGSPRFFFRGGSTLVIDQEPGKEGDVRYAIQKRLGQDDMQNERLIRQRKYQEHIHSGMAQTTYMDEHPLEHLSKSRRARSMTFNLIHRGY
ncbi:MAG: peptidase M4 [Acidobacteria bacterium]|nr:peptidase M4 [Acidobacteriota bacterium]